MQTPELWHLTHLALTAGIIMPVATFNHFHWLLAILKKERNLDSNQKPWS